jgi:hypothetical protein
MNKAAEFCKLVIDDDGRIGSFLCRELEIGVPVERIAGSFGFLIKDKIAGGVLFSDLRPGCDVWISIYANDKRWCCRRILRMIFGIAFELWGCRRINALVDTDNEQSLRLAAGVGFCYEGKMRKYRENGRDVYVLGMLKNECKFLKKRRKNMSNSFGGKTTSSGTSATVRPEAMFAANNFANYLKGLDTSTVDNTYQNLAGNAYALSSQLPNYIYTADGSDAARQRMENAVYNQAADRLNKQFAEDTSALNTRLQNQGLSVGSNAYQNAMSSLQDSQYETLNNAAYDSIIKGQSAFSNSLNDSVTAGNFTNNARQQSLSEILQILQNSISGYQVQKDIFDAISSASGQRTQSSSSQRQQEGINAQDIGTLAAVLAKGAATSSDIRLKENISPVGRLDNGLTVYRFNYIGSPQTQIGLIAQEVRDVKPDAVVVGDDGYLRVNYALACEK